MFPREKLQSFADGNVYLKFTMRSQMHGYDKGLNLKIVRHFHIFTGKQGRRGKVKLESQVMKLGYRLRGDHIGQLLDCGLRQIVQLGKLLPVHGAGDR